MSWFPNPLCLKLWGIFMKTIFYFFERRTLCSKSANYLNIETNAWKVSKYGVKSRPYFPAFGLNTERYSVSLCIQSEYKKIRTRNNSVFGHFSRSGQLDICDIKPFQANFPLLYSLQSIEKLWFADVYWVESKFGRALKKILQRSQERCKIFFNARPKLIKFKFNCKR